MLAKQLSSKEAKELLADAVDKKEVVSKQLKDMSTSFEALQHKYREGQKLIASLQKTNTNLLQEVTNKSAQCESFASQLEELKKKFQDNTTKLQNVLKNKQYETSRADANQREIIALKAHIKMLEETNGPGPKQLKINNGSGRFFGPAN